MSKTLKPRQNEQDIRNIITNFDTKAVAAVEPPNDLNGINVDSDGNFKVFPDVLDPLQDIDVGSYYISDAGTIDEHKNTALIASATGGCYWYKEGSYFSAWLRPDVKSGVRYFTIKDSSDNNVCYIQFDGTYLDFIGATTSSNFYTYSAAEWIHICIYAENAGTCKVWINGILYTTITGNAYDPEWLNITTASSVNIHVDAIYIGTTSPFTNIADGVVACKGIVSDILYCKQLRGSLDNLYFEESSDPDDPASGEAVLWVDSNGDLKMKINHSGTTKTGTILDYSAL